MFDLIDADHLGWTPDLGHIAKGEMDAVAVVMANRSFVKHVHIKDYDARTKAGWAKMGTGQIDFVDLASSLRKTGYEGWIMVEEETEQSASNPDEAIRDIGRYIANQVRPATQEQ